MGSKPERRSRDRQTQFGGDHNGDIARKSLSIAASFGHCAPRRLDFDHSAPSYDRVFPIPVKGSPEATPHARLTYINALERGKAYLDRRAAREVRMTIVKDRTGCGGSRDERRCFSQTREIRTVHQSGAEARADSGRGCTLATGRR